MLKKITALLFASLMLASLTACSADPNMKVTVMTPGAENEEKPSGEEEPHGLLISPGPARDTEDAETGESEPADVLLVSAQYPEMVQNVSSEDYIKPNGTFDDAAYEEDRAAWSEYWSMQFEKGTGLSEKLAAFNEKLGDFLAGAGTENRVFSPVSMYMALAILAEAAEGETREEILSLLGAENIEDARDTASRLFLSTYVDNGEYLADNAASLWLKQGLSVDEDVLQKIAESYFASVYQGDPEDPAYLKALQDWLNEKTGGMLKDAVENVKMDPEMVLSIATTVYFRGKWQYPFSAEENETLTFHGAAGDTEAEFMTKETDDLYSFYDHFGAVKLSFSGGAGMWLILPDEGYTPEEIAKEADFLKCISGEYDESHEKYCIINMKVPKFDVSSDLDMCDTLKGLGIEKAFLQDGADFTGLIREEIPVWLSEVKHAARCTIDEEGCTATAFTLEMLCGAAMPDGTVDFTLDRPFLFAITNSFGSVLFTGIVNQVPGK